MPPKLSQGEAVSLHALGVLFPKFGRAARWAKIGSEIVLRQMTEQVRDDGSHFEQSSYYHVYALDLFLFHQILADAGPDFRMKLGRMADAHAHAAAALAINPGDPLAGGILRGGGS